MTDRKVFIVLTEISNPNKEKGRKVLTEKKFQTTLWFGAHTRALIQFWRNHARNYIERQCLRWFKMRLCTEDAQESIRERIAETDKELKAINKTLGASVRFVQISFRNTDKDTYDAVNAAVSEQLLGELKERLTKLADLKEIPKRSRESLEKFLTEAEHWNVLGDKQVEKKIAGLRTRLGRIQRGGGMGAWMVEVDKDLKAAGSRMSFVEVE